jgi:hypothetical protein
LGIRSGCGGYLAIIAIQGEGEPTFGRQSVATGGPSMIHFISKIGARLGLAAIVTLTGLSVTAPTVGASEPGFGVYVQYRDGRSHHRRPGCAPWLAEEKARGMGLRRARVVDVSRRTVTVVGRDRYGRDRVVFANARGCPVIRR